MDENQDQTPPPAKWLTLPGRMLLIFTLLGGGGLFYWYFLSVLPSLPAGRYPIALWLAPVGIGGFFFFLLAAFLLEKAGVRIYQRDREP